MDREEKRSVGCGCRGRLFANQNETWQTLRDALSVREVLFASIPQLQVAMLKVYRQRETGDPELIIAGKREPGRQPAAREFFAHGGFNFTDSDSSWRTELFGLWESAKHCNSQLSRAKGEDQRKTQPRRKQE
jgi:hypothetical protein